MRRVALALVLVTLSACAYQHRHRSTSGPLAEAFTFHERDDRGTTHSFPRGRSARDVDIPDPGLVDIDSLIQIEIDKSKLGSGGAPRLDSQQARSMQEHHERLRALLAHYAAAADVRSEYAASYAALHQTRDAARIAPEKLDAAVQAAAQGSPLKLAWKRFVDARDALDASELTFLRTLKELYKDQPDMQSRLDEALESEAGVGGAVPFLEERLRVDLEAVNQAQDAWLAPLEDEKPQLELQIEAWLRSGDEQSQIHVPGYDDLDAGQVSRTRKSALDLSPKDLAELERQWNSTVKLAEALESYRLKKGGLDAVAEAAAGIVAPAVMDLIEELGALAKEIRDVDGASLVAGVKQDLDAFAQRVRDDTDAIGEEAAKALLATLTLDPSTSQTAADVATWAGDVAALAKDLERLRPEELPSIPSRISSLVDRGSELVESLPQLLDAKAKSLEESIEEALKPLKDAAEAMGESPERTKLLEQLAHAEKLIAKAELSGVQKALDTLRQLAERCTRVVQKGDEVVKLIRRLEPASDAPLPDPAGSVRSQRVAFEAIKSTGLDLLTAPRSPGDRVEVRARLYRKAPAGSSGDATMVDELESAFEVREFGWHDRLSPSVVLVRPTELSDLDENFSFAPVLSWVHRYGVRPEETGFTAGLQRFLDTSLGIHASFLNFDPEKEVEIGLGATLSFWRERLQIGAGVNLMGDATDDGRYYYFVGSDLISVLDSIGIGK